MNDSDGFFCQESAPTSEADSWQKKVSGFPPRMQLVYSLWKDYRGIPCCIKPTPVRKNEESKRSLSFCFAGEKEPEITKNLFETFLGKSESSLGESESRYESFREKFHEAVGGSGHELHRITTLHSSSLCAFLWFWGVAKDNPIKLSLNECDAEFYDSYFEVKNPVFRSPSNIDVVLTGKAGGRDVVLYLESKFSEYICNAGSGRVRDRKTGVFSNAYTKDSTVKSVLESLSDTKQFGKYALVKKETTTPDDDSFNLFWNDSACDAPLYAEGVKQMFAHYIGIRKNKDSDNPYRKDERLSRLSDIEHDPDVRLYLGTVLFDFKDEKLKPYLESYSSLYECVAKKLNQENKSNQNSLKLIEKPLLYGTDIPPAILPTKVRAFYDF